jgi:hypothetical protein
MNWDAISAVGEVLGAVAVVVTLFYLARQVREASEESKRNQMELRRTRYDALNRELISASDEWASSAELSDIMLRGFSGVASLDPKETFRFYSSLHRFFRSIDALFVYAAEGGVHDWGIERWRMTLADFMTFPGVQEYWEQRGHWFTDALRSEVNAVGKDSSAVMGRAYGS